MKEIKHFDILIIGFVFIILIAMPTLFVRLDGEISWRHITKIWQDNALLIPLYAVHHWLLLPHLMGRRRYVGYAISVALILAISGFVCDYIDPSITPAPNQPTPIPPYADMLVYAIFIIGVDSGLYFIAKWREQERRELELREEMTNIELKVLRNQVSPHFFMNTLNNIYALIESDSTRAKAAMMRLSKMMRYLLYERDNKSVKISKEFEFIESYIELMRLRFSESVHFNLSVPTEFNDLQIPPILFISFVENAIKHGVSYQSQSDIDIAFVIGENELHFTCSNDIHRTDDNTTQGGIGVANSLSRLKLLYGDSCKLNIEECDNRYNVSLTIPLQ